MPEEDILHQADVEAVIDENIEAGVGADNAAIADLAAPSATYVEAEALAARNKINLILAALRNNGIVDTA